MGVLLALIFSVPEAWSRNYASTLKLRLCLDMGYPPLFCGIVCIKTWATKSLSLSSLSLSLSLSVSLARCQINIQ